MHLRYCSTVPNGRWWMVWYFFKNSLFYIYKNNFIKVIRRTSDKTFIRDKMSWESVLGETNTGKTGQSRINHVPVSSKQKLKMAPIRRIGQSNAASSGTKSLQHHWSRKSSCAARSSLLWIALSWSSAWNRKKRLRTATRNGFGLVFRPQTPARAGKRKGEVGLKTMTRDKPLKRNGTHQKWLKMPEPWSVTESCDEQEKVMDFKFRDLWNVCHFT